MEKNRTIIISRIAEAKISYKTMKQMNFNKE